MAEKIKYKSDIEIAREATLKNIVEVAEKKLNIKAEHLDLYGHYKAKLSFDYINSLNKNKNGEQRSNKEDRILCANNYRTHIEIVMNGLPNLEKIRSVSNFGLSVVNIYFKDGTDIYTIDDILEIAQHRFEVEKKNKYAKYLDHRDLLKRN